MRRNRRYLLSLVVSIALVAGACTGAGEPPGAQPTLGEEGDGGEPFATPPDQQASPPVFQPEDDVLTVAIKEPSTLDPMRIADPGSVLIARQLFEGLTSWDPIEEEVVPAAAREWKVSDGGRTFTFKLRQGMTFHDGSPVTSRDFAFAFDRIALRSNASEIAYTLDRVVGFQQMNQLGSARHLAGISTPNDLTLVVRLTEPYYDFPAVLTHPGLVPLERDAVADIDSFLAQPNGNGPFQMAQPWSVGGPALLKAFLGFIDTPDIDGIRFLPYPDAAASWLPFLDGELDVAEVPAGQAQDAENRFGAEGFKPLLAGYYYGFNLSSPELENATLRKAINKGIDRAEIAGAIYQNTLEEPRGIVPRGIPGFDENICVSLCRFSPEAARRLVRKVPRKARSVILEYTEGEPHSDVARAIKEDLSSIGLDVKLRAYPFNAFVRRLRDGNQEVYRLGWIAEYPVADVFLSALFASGSPDNHSGFASGKVDDLLAQAHATASATKRTGLYVQAEKLILRSLPVVPIGHFVSRWAAQPEVQDIAFDVMGGFDAVGVSLAEEDEG